jgi:hypothetical protein
MGINGSTGHDRGDNGAGARQLLNKISPLVDRHHDIDGRHRTKTTDWGLRTRTLPGGRTTNGYDKKDRQRTRNGATA